AARGVVAEDSRSAVFWWGGDITFFVRSPLRNRRAVRCPLDHGPHAAARAGLYDADIDASAPAPDGASEDLRLLGARLFADPDPEGRHLATLSAPARWGRSPVA